MPAPQPRTPQHEAGSRGGGTEETDPLEPTPQWYKELVRIRVGGKTGNDPSAGSPTETLLRLLLPLNDKVWAASRGIAAGEPAALPQSGDLTGSFNR